MDTTVLRIIIAAIGVVVVLGIYLWDYARRRRNQPQPARSKKQDPLPEEILDTNPEETWHNAETDIGRSAEADLSVDSTLNNPEETTRSDAETGQLSFNPADQIAVEPVSMRADPSAAEESEPVAAVGFASAEANIAQMEDMGIIQLSLVPEHQGHFSGPDLLGAFEDAELEYGTLGIFHRYQGKDEGKTCLFSVASMVEPGTFPVEDMASFKSPGITLFLQIDAVPEPIEAFDDLIKTCHNLMIRLFGKLRDSRRQELTMEVIESMRDALKSQIAASGNG